MITRRKLISTGAVATGVSLATVYMNVLSARQISPSRPKRIVIATDDLSGGLGLGKVAEMAATRLAVGTRDIQKVAIPTRALTHMADGLELLRSQKGSAVICAMDQAKCFVFDEILRASRVRVMFKSEHLAMELDRGPVRHSAVELPVSTGVSAALPNTGPWSDRLMASLALVADRQWPRLQTGSPAPISNDIRPATAKLALATYVLEI